MKLLAASESTSSIIDKSITPVCLTIFLAALLSSSMSHASIDEAAVLKLIDQVEALTERVDQLEVAAKVLRTENIELRNTASASTSLNNRLAWIEKIKLKGDFRYRYENIDDDKNLNDQNRSRLRARIEVQAEINDTWKVGLGLASGGDKPTTSNQTLGGGGSTKGIHLDLAYFDWSGIKNTNVIGGKFKNPFYRASSNSLLWDNDYRPEGLAVKYDNGLLFATAALLYLESDDKAGAQDAESYWGIQAGFHKEIGDGINLLAGISYYDIPVAGSTPFYGVGPGADGAFGNALAADGTYLNDYEELELFAELKFNIGNIPASVFYDWVENQDASDDENGFSTGFQVGKAGTRGTWQMSYIYQDLEADAVLGLTTDSDYGGGGTNNKGHLFYGAYALNNNTIFSLTYYLQEYGDLDTDYDRLSIDLKFKY